MCQTQACCCQVQAKKSSSPLSTQTVEKNATTCSREHNHSYNCKVVIGFISIHQYSNLRITFLYLNTLWFHHLFNLMKTESWLWLLIDETNTLKHKCLGIQMIKIDLGIQMHSLPSLLQLHKPKENCLHWCPTM